MRTHLYVDGDNLFNLQRLKDRRIDHKRFLDLINEKYELDEAYYYASLPEGTEYDGRRKFLTAVATFGYKVTTRPPKQYNRGASTYMRGCSDMWMCRDIILNLNRFDRCIMVTGDGDFECVIETLQARNKEFLVISTPPIIGEVLRRAIGMRYLDIDTLWDRIEKKEESNGVYEETVNQ